MRTRTLWKSQRKKVMNLESLTTSGLSMVSYGQMKGKTGHQGSGGDKSPIWTMPLGCDINTGSLAFSFPCTAVISVIVALFNLGSFSFVPRAPQGPAHGRLLSHKVFRAI